MNRIYTYLSTLVILSLAIACSDDPSDLPPAADRANEAISALKAELTAPTNGWQLNYRPTPDAGTFLIFLNFDNDGTVNIKADVAYNNGQFANETIPYRIDNSLGLELIFETYGVFHYLFEQQQASFGAEFEFIYASKEGNNLIFESKTDSPTDLSIVTFEPAGAGAESALSIDISENFEKFSGQSPVISGSTSHRQQIIFNNHNISIFWKIDLLKREIEVDLIGTGTTVQSIVGNTDNVISDHSTGFSFFKEKMLLEKPLSFSSRGTNFTIDQIALKSFNEGTGPSLCTSGIETTPTYDAEIPGIGDITIQRTLFASSGTDFKPQAESSYNVNVTFVFGSDGFSLAETGSISEKFPSSVAFVFNYGFDSEEEPANAVGFILEDKSNQRRTYLREFDVVFAEGNMLQISLKNSFYYSATPNANDEQNLIQVTDEIFGNGEIYAYNFPVEQDFKLFNLYNPCNSVEFFLVQ